VSVFGEASTHTYSLSEEGFGYNYGQLKSSASHASRENILLSCWKIQKCSRNLLRRFADGRTDGAYLGGRRCVGRVHSVVYNASAASAETRGAGHMLSEKSQRTQNGTMFVGLDWPLNASCRLSASAKLLVSSGAAVMFFFPIFLDHISTQISDRSSFDLLPQHPPMNLVASITASSTDESKLPKRSRVCPPFNFFITVPFPIPCSLATVSQPVRPCAAKRCGSMFSQFFTDACKYQLKP